jgi:ABC-2 type transport system permease protein
MPIFDQGYQRWSGELSGHAWRWLAVARHGIRVSMKNRLLRLVLLLSWMPAAAFAAALCVWGLLEQGSPLIASIRPFLTFLSPAILNNPQEFRTEIWTLAYHYFLSIELWFSMVLIVLVGPNLISRDLRYNALPLYLSRPLRRIDYFLGKLGVIVGILSLVTIVPSILAYVLGLLFSLDLSIVRDTFGILLASVAYGLLISVSAGLFVLALSSLSRNSRYIALLWIGIWLVGGSVSGLLNSVDAHQRQREIRRQSMRQYEESGVPFVVFDQQEMFDQEMQARRENWRPLVWYMANLSRIEHQLLDTDASWTKLAGLLPPGARERVLRDNLGPQYPWQWSAGVLLGLFGLSVWILNRSVKSLDRLK